MSQLLSSFGQQIEPTQTADVGFGELTKKNAETFNSVAQLAKAAEEDLYSINTVEENFNPFEQPEFENYKQFADSFTDVYNRKSFERKIKKIDSELEYYKLAENSTWYENLASDLLVGISDPLNYVGAGQIKNAYSMASRQYMKEMAKRGAIVAGGTQIASEAISQATMETRTAIDSGVSISAATLLGGTLGAAASYLRRPLNETAEVMERELDEFEAIRSVGAAQVTRGVNTTMEQETLVGALGLEKAFGAKGVPIVSSVVRSPTLSLLNSPSLAARKIAQELAEIPNKLKKFDEGIAAPDAVESLMRNHTVKVLDVARDMEQLFKQYRQAGTVKIVAQDVSSFLAKSDTRKMTMFEFREAVGEALINNDTHPIPEVQQAAKSMRQKLYEPLKNEAIKLGLLPDDIDELIAESYFTRVYNQELIAAERPQFENAAYQYVADAQKNVNEYADKVSSNLDKARAEKASIEAEIEELSVLNKDVAPELRKDREKLKRREYSLNIEMARLKEAEKTFRDFSKLSDEKKVAVADEQIKSLVKEWKSGVKEPKTLTQFIRSKGGIWSDEVNMTDLIRNDTKNLVRQSGKTLDDLGQMAVDEGYFPERPTINELTEALENEIRGQKTYSVVDASDAAEANMRLGDIEEIDKMFNELGITKDMSNEQIAQLIAKDKGQNLKLATSKNKAISAQAKFYERYAFNRLKKIDEKIVKIQNEATDLSARVSTAGGGIDLNKAIIGKKARALSVLNERISRMNRLIDENRIFATMNEGELRDVATELTETILGMSQAVTHYKMPALSRGSLKERTFHIPTKMISRWIEKDALSVAKRYTRSVASDIELTRKFGRADMRDQIQEISSDYAQELKKAVARGAKESEIADITAKQKMDLEHINGIRERLQGTYAMPSNEWGVRGRRVAKVITGYNVVTSLGGMLLSSMTDAFAAVTVHGIDRMFKGSIKNFGKRIKRIERPEQREGELAGVIGEAYLNSRATAVTDILDPYNQGTKIERAVGYISQKSVGLTGFNIYTDAMREIIAGVTIERSMKAIEALATGAKIKPKEVSRLAMFGIDANDAKLIYAEFKKHGKIEDGEYVVNSQKWDNVNLSRKWSAALGKEILKGNMQPGQEKPLFMSTGLGSVMFQFKSFVAAANQRILIAGLQQRDSETLQGIIGMIATGMLVGYLRMDEKDMPDDLNGWLREGIDRSGVFGWTMEANNIVEKISGNNVGLSAIMGTRPASRYSSRGSMGALLGPTFGKADDLLKVLHATGTGEFTEADAKRIRRLMFLQNNWYLKGMFDEVEEGLKEALVY